MGIRKYLQGVIEGSQHIIVLAKNASWLLVERAIRLLLGFIVGLWVANYFGPEKYSTVGYVMAYVTIIRALTGLGLRSIMVRELVRTPEKLKELLGSAFGMLLVSSLLGYALSLTLVYFDDYGNSTSLIMMALMGLPILLFPSQLISYFFESRVESRFAVRATTAGYLAGVVFKLWIVLRGGTLIHLGYAYALDAAVAAILLVYMGRARGLLYAQWRFVTDTARRLFSDSWVLVLAAVMVTIYMQVDKIMIKNIAGDLENGYYTFAVQLAEACYFLPVVLQQSSFPNLVATDTRDRWEFTQKLNKLMRIIVVVSIGVIAGAFLLSDWVFSWLAPQYMPATSMLKIIILALPFVGAGLVQGSFLISRNLLRFSFFLTAMGMVSNLAMNFWLIPIYGGFGAAVSTVVSYSIAGIFGGLCFRPTRRFSVLMLRSFLLLKAKTPI